MSVDDELLPSNDEGALWDNWTSKSEGWKSRLDWLVLCLGFWSLDGHLGASFGLGANFGLGADIGLVDVDNFGLIFGLLGIAVGNFGIDVIFVCLTVLFGIVGTWFWSGPGHNEVNIPLPCDWLPCEDWAVWPQVIGL